MITPKIIASQAQTQKVRRERETERTSPEGKEAFQSLLSELSATPKASTQKAENLIQKELAENPSRENERNEIDQAVWIASKKYDVPKELIHAVIHAESHYKPQATSPVGAQGLMQLMPETANTLGVRNPYDIKQNIDGGTKYLRQLLNQFDGNVAFAVAGYNAGPHRVAKLGRIPNFAETQAYVPKVLGQYKANLLASRSESGTVKLASLKTDMSKFYSINPHIPLPDKVEESASTKAMLEPSPYLKA